MIYCTPQSLLDRGLENELIQLTNLGNPAESMLNATVLDKSIATACAWIDSFITAYLPLSVIPANFEPLACDETIYQLYKNTRSIPDAVKATHDEALKYLTGLRDGTIALAGDDTGNIDTPLVNDVDFISVDPAFSSNTLTGF